MTEEWRTIPGFELYEASSDGRIRRSTSSPRTNSTYPGRILSPDGSTGYLRVTVHQNGKMSRQMVHRLIARTFMNPARPRMQINHKDGNKSNNRVDNLEWCTPQENVIHAWSGGLCTPNSGERHGCAMLTNRDIDVIRLAASRGVPQRHIASVFNVNDSTISMIVIGKSWGHVKPTEGEDGECEPCHCDRKSDS